jgi:protein SERAC1
MWLRDFFSKDLPRCRTLIYGYHSKLSSHGIGTILDYGREFMEEIKKVRYTKEVRRGPMSSSAKQTSSLTRLNDGQLQERPLFFIAHSFGGIILAHVGGPL